MRQQVTPLEAQEAHCTQLLQTQCIFHFLQNPDREFLYHTAVMLEAWCTELYPCAVAEICPCYSST